MAFRHLVSHEGYRADHDLTTSAAPYASKHSAAACFQHHWSCMVFASSARFYNRNTLCVCAIQLQAVELSFPASPQPCVIHDSISAKHSRSLGAGSRRQLEGLARCLRLHVVLCAHPTIWLFDGRLINLASPNSVQTSEPPFESRSLERLGPQSSELSERNAEL